LNLLDENFPRDQRPLLQEWRIPFRQIGREFAFSGVQDLEIIPLLHRERRVTFFTLDADFYAPSLCHNSYCLVLLDLRSDDTAYFLKRFLRHARFNTTARRMGTVVRVHPDGVHFWERKKQALQRIHW
jgi:hypothetical protein